LHGFLFPEYCSHSSALQDTNLNVMIEAELAHLVHIASIKPSNWWFRNGCAPTFKQRDAAWLLFYAIASLYESDKEAERGISIKV